MSSLFTYTNMPGQPIIGQGILKIIDVMESLHTISGLSYFKYQANDWSLWVWAMHPDRKMKLGLSQDAGKSRMLDIRDKESFL